MPHLRQAGQQAALHGRGGVLPALPGGNATQGDVVSRRAFCLLCEQLTYVDSTGLCNACLPAEQDEDGDNDRL